MESTMSSWSWLLFVISVMMGKQEELTYQNLINIWLLETLEYIGGSIENVISIFIWLPTLSRHGKYFVVVVMVAFCRLSNDGKARKVGICVQGQSCFGRGFFYHGPPRCILQQLCSLVSFADCTDHHIPNREWSHKEPLHQRQRSVGGCYLAFTTEKMSLLLHAIMVFKSWTTNLCKWFLFFCFSVAVFKVGIYNATK